MQNQYEMLRTSEATRMTHNRRRHSLPSSFVGYILYHVTFISKISLPASPPTLQITSHDISSRQQSHLHLELSSCTIAKLPAVR